MQGCSHTEHCRTQLCYTTRTELECTSVRCICNWNTSVRGHKQDVVGFSQHRTLPRSTANSSVSGSSCTNRILFFGTNYNLNTVPMKKLLHTKTEVINKADIQGIALIGIRIFFFHFHCFFIFLLEVKLKKKSSHDIMTTHLKKTVILEMCVFIY
jgi:hypothetical protein